MTGQHVPAIDDLHEVFRSLITLTTLVAAINNKGHPKLAWPFDLHQSTFETEQSTIGTVLNCLAALLVRDAEAIAAAPCDPRPSQANASVPSMHLVVMEGVSASYATNRDEPGSALGGLAPHDCGDNDEDTSRIYSDTDKAKPHETNTYFADNSGNYYTLVNASGASHLSHIDSWHYNLNLRQGFRSSFQSILFTSFMKIQQGSTSKPHCYCG